LKLRTVRGVFNKCYGQIEFDGSNVSQMKVHAQIDADTLDTEIKMRDRAIKGDDFLKVGRYPMITFESTRIVPLSKNEFTMYGNLTIRRDTKEVAVDVHGPDTFGKTVAGKTCFTARASAKLNRKDFGMNYSSALISDNVSVLLSVRVIQGEDPEANTRAAEHAKKERTLRIEQHFKSLQQEHKH
jgi:polyisoprenoid-binding protein YceI